MTWDPRRGCIEYNLFKKLEEHFSYEIDEFTCSDWIDFIHYLQERGVGDCVIKVETVMTGWKFVLIEKKGRENA